MLKMFRRTLVRQFRKPSGLLGRFAGWIMATRTSNRARSLWTVGLLDLEPADNVLEIGYGPGVALGAVAQKVTRGAIVGVDHSGTMMKTAGRRNQSSIRSERMKLHIGSAEALSTVINPAEYRFNHIFAVNVALFWSDPEETVRLLKEYLASNGQIALTVQPRAKGATNQDTVEIGEALAAQMQRTGLDDIKIDYFKEVSPFAVCVRGRSLRPEQ